MRIAVLDHRVILNNPIGSCHLRLLSGLAAEHEFTVFAPQFANPDPARIRHVRVPVPVRPQFLLFVAYHLLAPFCLAWHRLRTGQRFDLVQSVECNSLVRGLSYAHFCHTAFLRQPQPPRGLSPRRWLRWVDHRLRALMEPWAYRRARCIVVPSEGVGRDIAQSVPGTQPRLRVIRNPIRDDLRTPEPGFDRAAFRSRQGVPADAVVFLFASLGHFERKGLGLLIQAVIRCEAPVHAWIVGGQPAELARYRLAAQEGGVGGRVRFAGFQQDMRPWFWGADAFVLPSSYEACPLVALEAAAAGLPLIATRLHGVEDFAREGENAFIIDRDVASLTAAITALARLPPAARLAMGAAAAASVQRYTAAGFVASWRDTFGSVAALPRPGRQQGPERPAAMTQSGGDASPA